VSDVPFNNSGAFHEKDNHFYCAVLLTIVNCTSWLLYGFYVDDPMVSAQNFFAIPVFVYITAKAARWRSANPDYVANAV
jgi:hypothetical protein